MQVFIVTMEYLGAGACGRRVPVCEHAYDLETATLAGHPAADMPRVAFPSCQRDWNTEPQTDRCPDRDTAVQRIIRDLITAALSAIISRLRRPAQSSHNQRVPCHRQLTEANLRSAQPGFTHPGGVD